MEEVSGSEAMVASFLAELAQMACPALLELEWILVPLDITTMRVVLRAR